MQAFHSPKLGSRPNRTGGNRTTELSPPSADAHRHALVAARDHARRAFQDVLLRLEAAATTPDGVHPALEQERDRARAALLKAVRDLERSRGHA